MVNNNISKKEWQNIINTYYTGYYMNEFDRIKRRNYRALYLSNIDYLKQNKYLNNFKKIQDYNKWYIRYYNINVPLSKNNNKLP